MHWPSEEQLNHRSALAAAVAFSILALALSTAFALAKAVGLELPTRPGVPNGVVARKLAGDLASHRAAGEPARVQAAGTTTWTAGLALSPGYALAADAGDTVTYSHRLTNTGTVSDVVTVGAVSERGWPLGLRALRGVADATSAFTVGLVPGEAVSFSLIITLPHWLAPPGGEVRTTVTARSAVSPVVAVSATDVAIIPHRLYLPLARLDPPTPAKLGVDFGYLVRYPEVLAFDFPLAREMGANWIRLWLAWRDIERSPGVYDWAAMDTRLGRARELGFEPLVVVYSAPDWASALPCGPVDDLAAFERFIRLTVERYRWVQAWEYTNEPDGRAPHRWGPAIGCWGPYPCQYADHLRRFHQQVKSVNPSALVFHGGLAYDNWELFDRQFFTNTLACGAGKWFDGLSLHYYPINFVEFPTMPDKMAEVQGTMRRHGVYGKYIWITETSMWSNYGATLDHQKDFIVKDQTRGLCAGADNLFWFDIRQAPTDPVLWRWLISRDHQPDQGYFTYQHYAQQIVGSHCEGRVQLGEAELEAYRFRSAGADTYIIWSNGSPRPVRLPAPSGAVVTDRDGLSSQELVPDDSGWIQFQVGSLPLFVRVAAGNSQSNLAVGGAQQPLGGVVGPGGDLTATLQARAYLPIAAADEWLTGPSLADDFSLPGEPDGWLWSVFAGRPVVEDGWLTLTASELRSVQSYGYGLLRLRVRSGDWLSPDMSTESRLGLENWTGVNGTCYQAAYLGANGQLVVRKSQLQPSGICVGEAETAVRPLTGWTALWLPGQEAQLDVALLWTARTVSLTVAGAGAQATAVYDGPLIPSAPLRVRLLAEPGRRYRFDYVRFQGLR